MIRLIEDNREAIAELCRRYHVATLEVFGSAATGEFDEATSDLDFLVTYHRSDQVDAVEQYFGLIEELERLFGRHVDLVAADAMRNPYFIKSVNKSRQPLYAA